MKSSRQFGTIPDWAKRGPVTPLNYDLRAEWHGATIRQWEDQWPFVSTKPEYQPPTADQAAWERYFLEVLREFPASYRLFKRGVISSYNFPEATPELFDTGYVPRPKLRGIE